MGIGAIKNVFDPKCAALESNSIERFWFFFIPQVFHDLGVICNPPLSCVSCRIWYVHGVSRFRKTIVFLGSNVPCSMALSGSGGPGPQYWAGVDLIRAI